MVKRYKINICGDNQFYDSLNLHRFSVAHPLDWCILNDLPRTIKAKHVEYQ